MTVHTTTSLFLVVADREPRHVDLAGIGSWLVSAVFRACDSPLDPREIRAYADWDGPDPPPSIYHAVLSAVTPANRQPHSAQITRAFARAVAAQSGGLLIDWVTREIVLASSRPERAAFRLGDQWLGFARHVYDERHRSPPTDACAAIRITTRGLVRFGLPELGIDDVDCANRLVALNVLRALAQYLFWSGRPPGRIQPVSRDAFAAYWGSASAGDSAFTAALTERGGLLWVAAPHDESLNDWLAGLEGSLQSLAACPPDDFSSYEPLEVDALDHNLT